MKSLMPQSARRAIAATGAIVAAFSRLHAQDADAASGPVYELSPFEVSTERQYGYRAGTSVSGTRTATEVKSLPFSLQIVTDELISDLKISDLEDAVRFAPGVQDNRDNLGSYGKFNVRGIQQTYSLRNGFRRYGPNDTSSAAQVEVVKGPAGLLYGQVFPGGVVNVVTKKPLTISHYTVEARYSSYGSYRGSTDFGGPLNESKSLSYRLISAYEDWNSFVDYYGRRVKVLVPSMSYAPTDWLKFTFEYERYIREEDAPHAGMMAVNLDDLARAIANPNDPFGILNGPYNPQVVRSASFTGIADYLPRSFNANGPGTFNNYKSNAYTLYTDVRMANWLSFRSVALYYDYQQAYYANFVNNTMRSGLDIVSRANFRDNTNEVVQSQNDFTIDLTTGPVTHKILAGGEYYQDSFFSMYAQETPGSPKRSQYYTRLPNPYNVTKNWALEFRYVNPIADFAPSPRPADLAAPEVSGDRETSGYAGYVTDQLTLLQERLRLIGGARWEKYETSDFVTNNTDDESAWTYQGGFLYKVTEAAGLFGSYSESFYRNEFYGRDSAPGLAGTLAPPQRGQGIDIGVKFESADSKWAGAVSYFDLSQTDILVNAEVDGAKVQILAGERTSKGVEADFHIAPSAGWQILLNYAYTIAEDVKSGMAFPNVPKHQASVWTRYEFTEGALEGLFLGGGALYMGDRPAGNDANLFEQSWRFTSDAYVTIDAFIGRKFPLRTSELEVQVNVANLTDKEYIRGGQTLPSEPRRLTLSATWKY